MTILPNFHALAEAIARLEPCSFAGVVTPDQIKVVMVEHGLIPASLVDAVLAE
jgi:hypothetical protein